jgi:hypothetical protein
LAPTPLCFARGSTCFARGSTNPAGLSKGRLGYSVNMRP